MVNIKEINWMSEEALEAEVIITDGRFELLCFSHPFKKNKGDQLLDPLYAFEPDEIVKLETPSFRIERLSNAFDYLIEGKLIDKESGHVKLGNIIIEIENHFIPRDFKDGDNISFKCNRLDIY